MIFIPLFRDTIRHQQNCILCSASNLGHRILTRLSLKLVLLLLVGSASLAAAPPIQASIGDTEIPSWPGAVYSEKAPWHYHPALGWFYANQTEIDATWGWTYGVGWFWTSSHYYPYIYSDRRGDWYYYDGWSEAGSSRYLNTRTNLIEEDIFTSPIDNWNARLEQIRAVRNLPSIAMVLIKDGRIRAEGIAGSRIRNTQSPATLNDPFHIGSLTKSMTAFLVGTFVQEGLLGWQDTLGSLPGIEPKSPNSTITLASLLNHTSGLPRMPSNYDSWYERSDSLMEQRREWTWDAGQANLNSSPSKKFNYSNWGYVAAGGWIEQISSKTWEQNIRERIFEPFGLTTAGFGAAKGNVPWGHNSNGQPVNPTNPKSDNAPVMGPAGTVHMSVRDLATYGAMHLAGLRKEVTSLSSGMFSILHTPYGQTAQNAEYAYGWFVGEQPNYLWHDGSNTLNYAYLLLLPDSNAAIALVTNQGGNKADSALNELQVELLQYYHLTP